VNLYRKGYENVISGRMVKYDALATSIPNSRELSPLTPSRLFELELEYS